MNIYRRFKMSVFGDAKLRSRKVYYHILFFDFEIFGWPYYHTVYEDIHDEQLFLTSLI